MVTCQVCAAPAVKDHEVASVDNSARNRIIRERLHNMCGCARERRALLSKYSAVYSKEDWYVRVGGNGLTLVSVNDKYPLIGFAGRPKPARTGEEIESLFKSRKSRTLREPAREVPERRVQAWLIKQALSKNGDLSSTLGLHPARFGTLLFGFDEVSLGDRKHIPTTRCDVLAVRVRDRKASLVIIELKSRRNLNELRYQLDDFKNEVKTFQGEFERLLSSCVGCEVSCAQEDIGKLIVWPGLENSHDSRRGKSMDRCREYGIDVVEYSWDRKAPIQTIKFCPAWINRR